VIVVLALVRPSAPDAGHAPQTAGAPAEVSA
jgi:hypothetical protein